MQNQFLFTQINNQHLHFGPRSALFRKSKDGVLGGLNLQLVTLFLHTLQQLGSPECSRALSLWQIYIKKNKPCGAGWTKEAIAL